MFRRKEEGLFDSTTDSNQLENDAVESAAVSSTAPAASYQAPAAPSFNSAPAQAAAPAAPRPAAPAPAQTASAFRPSAPAAAPLSADLSRRLPDNKPAAATAQTVATTAGKTKRVLTVGNDILLKGEIATCDRLVIEGKVDATLNDVHTVEITESGSFKGSAQIEDAEISGLFEGDLIVRGRLVIYATGKVRGKISYGEIEIERGGEMTGEIKIAGASAGARAAAPRQNAPKEDKVAA